MGIGFKDITYDKIYGCRIEVHAYVNAVRFVKVVRSGKMVRSV